MPNVSVRVHAVESIYPCDDTTYVGFHKLLDLMGIVPISQVHVVFLLLNKVSVTERAVSLTIHSKNVVSKNELRRGQNKIGEGVHTVKKYRLLQS